MRRSLLNGLAAVWLQTSWAASGTLKLTNCKWIETGEDNSSEDVSLDNSTNPASFACDGKASSVAIYRSAKEHRTLSLQCEFDAGTARVEKISWRTSFSSDCANSSGTLPETVVDGVFLTRQEGSKEWAADEAKSPVKVDSTKLFSFVVLKTPQQEACGGLVARIDEVIVQGESIATCSGELTGRRGSQDKADTSHLKFQCSVQDVDSCDQKYTRTTNSKYIQCGMSDTNCLSIGPLCTPE
mmetsp:Transcript_32346/g.60884  ORF Transcript_32346/g.60884 Transcript_32346/m.60884 type:complete len:241 (+) Transcript_32346:35-757(+)